MGKLKVTLVGKKATFIDLEKLVGKLQSDYGAKHVTLHKREKPPCLICEVSSKRDASNIKNFGKTHTPKFHVEKAK